MITNLQLNNFKAHKIVDLPLARLNVFTGLNGTGKSSVIHSLLLLRQSYLKNMIGKGLVLNGDLVEIGVGNDALNEGGENICFKLKLDEKTEMEWIYDKNLFGSFLKTLSAPTTQDYELISLFNSHFQYISAEHFSAFETHKRDSLQVEENRQISEKKGGGEHAVYFLDYYGDKEKLLDQSLQHHKVISDNIREQTDAWLGEISPGVRTVIKVNESQNNLQLRFQFKSEYGYTNEFKPENVGFGISYVLPILVAILTARHDSLIILENPEAHLHPIGQASLAELIALAAQAGIQIIMETHSDHIINGIQIAAKKFAQTGRGISADNVKMYFFKRAPLGTSTEVVPVRIEADGRVHNAPEGFFDQIDNDLRTLIGF